MIAKDTTLVGDDVNIPYFVTDQFTVRYGRNLNELRKVEKQVYREYHDVLYQKCTSEREDKRQRIDRVRGGERGGEDGL